jgi:hypothetical protein
VTPYSPAQAKWEFWSDYHAANITAIADARQHLIDAMSVDPADDELPRLVGMSYALTTNEATTPPSQQEVDDATQSQGMYLDTARGIALDPNAKALDDVLYSGYPIFLGTQMNDASLIQQGLDLQNAVIAQDPVLGHFSTATILIRSPRSSPYFAQGVEHYFKFLEACTGTTISRTAPDVTAMLHGTTVHLLCQNNRNVPHVLQGGLMLFADVLVKNNQIDAAPAIYQAIKQTDGFATWKFQSAVDQRLSSDLAARAATYDNANPMQQAPMNASPCFACHE